MITFGTRRDDGTQVLVIGLDGDDDRQLIAGRLLHLGADEMEAAGMPRLEVLLTVGRTQGDILDRFRAGGISVTDLPGGGGVRYSCPHQASNFMPCQICGA